MPPMPPTLPRPQAGPSAEDDYAKQIADKRAAVEVLAAKFGLAKKSAPEPEDTSVPFAERSELSLPHSASNLDTHPSFSFSRHSRMQDKAGAGFRTEES